MNLFTILFSQLLLLTFQTTAQESTKPHSTISLWLPWLPNYLFQTLDASAINAVSLPTTTSFFPELDHRGSITDTTLQQSTATTYALSCPTGAALPSGVERACIINGPLPQTATAGPSTVIMTRSLNGNYESWGCQHSVTSTGSCQVRSTTSGEGPGQKSSLTTFPAESMVFRPVTITAGSPTVGAPVSFTIPTPPSSDLLTPITDSSLLSKISAAGAPTSFTIPTPPSSDLLTPITDSSLLSEISAAGATKASSVNPTLTPITDSSLLGATSSADTNKASSSTKATASTTDTSISATNPSTSESPAKATKNAAVTYNTGSERAWVAVGVGLFAFAFSIAGQL